jgi:predicted solute-binding protein
MLKATELCRKINLGWGCGPVVQHLPSMCKALSSILALPCPKKANFIICKLYLNKTLTENPKPSISSTAKKKKNQPKIDSIFPL